MQRPEGIDFSQDQVDHLISLYTQGRLQEALAEGMARAVQYPEVAFLHSFLGAVYMRIGRKEEAVISYQRAIALQSDDVEAHYNLGKTLQALGNRAEAIISYQSALQLKPDRADIHNSLGIALSQLGRYGEAVTSFQNALTYQPGYAAAHMNLGNSLSNFGKHSEAIVSYQRACDLQPENAVAHYSCGIALSNLARHEEAGVSFGKAVDLDKKHVKARGCLIHELALLCDWAGLDKATQGDLRLLEFGVHPREVMSPFCLLNLVDDARFHRRAAEAFSSCHFKPKSELGPLSIRKDSDRIRIGYYSADFHNHATMYLMAELFEKHNRAKFEIHAFSFGPKKEDEMYYRLLNSVERFHDVQLYDDRQIAAVSRSLGIDVAVDLKGYTTNCRTGIFSYRAAPIQVNYLGYPGTMGAPYIDYIIADPVLIPPSHQEFYSENVAYMPTCYQVNDSTRVVSDRRMSRADFGLPEYGVVFCCFNNSYKITRAVFDVWMRLLDQVHGSVLWLLRSNKCAEQNLRMEAKRRGINPERLVFAQRMRPQEHLARHRLADLFLDTSIYNAHTTCSDALWAGLPVITKMGETFASRVAGSLLSAIDLPELVTNTEKEYEQTALMLATQPAALGAVREKLAQNLKTTMLFDASRFAEHIEAAFSQMVHRESRGLPPTHLYVQK